jgi:hypothetical protein
MDSLALSDYLTSTERLYLDIRQPVPAKPAPPKVAELAAPLHLEPWDVDAIVRKKRSASADELQYVIDHAKRFCLTTRQRDEIGVRLTLAVVNRARPTLDPTTIFLYESLHVIQTPAGLLQDCEWIQREMKAGASAISNCRWHRPPRCECWRSARERLWQIQDRCGSKSPEGWATERLWGMFEEMEQAERPQRARLGAASQSLPEGIG